MIRLSTVAACLAVCALASLGSTPPAAHAQSGPDFTLVGVGERPAISADGSRLAFLSPTDSNGGAPGAVFQAYLRDGTTVFQVTTAPVNVLGIALSGDGRTLAYLSTDDPVGGNPDHSSEIFLWRDGLVTQVTTIAIAAINSRFALDFDGDRLAFSSTGNPLGTNPDASEELFLWDAAAGITQLTNLPRSASDPPTQPFFHARSVSLGADGLAIAFESNADLVAGNNPDVNDEIFLWRQGAGFQQITKVASAGNANLRSQLPALSADGRSVAFVSRGNLAGRNADLSQEVFVWNGTTFVQATRVDTAGGADLGFDVAPPSISGDGGLVVFQGTIDPFGTNPDRSLDLFLWDGSVLQQVTRESASPSHGSEWPALAATGRTLAFATRAFLGQFPDIVTTTIDVPPPPGPWLSSPALPGFEVKARFTPGGTAPPIIAALEGDCTPETLCLSGARAGRPEVFVKVIGPRPNGFLWAQICRFTPSQVEIWLRRPATGQVNVYVLGAVSADAEEVSGLQDRTAFAP